MDIVMLHQIKRLINFLFPATCFLCQEPAHRALDLCHACEQDLPSITIACQRCRQPVAASQQTLCGRCLTEPPPYHACYVFWDYQTPMNYLIKQLKFSGQLCVARLLGELLAAKLRVAYANKPLPECLIPVPLHTSRLRQRGFNQALVIAKTISRALAIPLDYQSCTRHRATTTQSELPAKNRLQNVKNAFSLNKPISYRHIALVDDVITTGHTLAEFSKLLQPYVQQIDIWCCARTVL